jgi:hypothetical protein
MKKLMIGCIASFAVTLLATCKTENHNGSYAASLKSEYSVAEDTIIIKDNIVTNRVGYRRILNGELKPKKWSVKQWRLNEWGSAVIIFQENGLLIGDTQYKRID